MDIDFGDWANESYENAKRHVYMNIEQHESPSDAYIKQAKPVAEKSIVKAGLRLAYLLAQLNLEEHMPAKVENKDTMNAFIIVSIVSVLAVVCGLTLFIVVKKRKLKSIENSTFASVANTK